MSIHEDLKAYLDGELDPGRAEEVRLAIESDPALKREAEFMRSLGSEIRAVSIELQVQGLDRALDALLPKKPWWSAPALRTSLAFGVPLLAGLVLVALLGKGLMSGQSEMEAATDQSASLSKKSAYSGSTPQKVKEEAGIKPSADSAPPAGAADESRKQRRASLDIEVDDPPAAFDQTRELARKYKAELEQQPGEQKATITVPLKDADALMEDLNGIAPNAKVTKPQDQENESAGPPPQEDMASIDVTFRDRAVPDPVKPREMVRPDGVVPPDASQVWVIAVPATIILLGGIWFALRRRS